MLGNNLLRRFIANAAGFTLMEVVVAMGLLSLAVSMVGSGVFQVLHTEQFWQDGVLATRDLRHAFSWFAGDALNTEATNLVDSAPAANTVMLTNFIGDEITYNVNLQNELIRSHWDGFVTLESTLATDVQSASFASVSDVLSVTLVVYTNGTNTETLSLDTKLR